jgi:transcriptional regulator with XRE-family HTH domain
MITTKAISAAIRRVRTRHGLSMRRAAEKANVSLATWENAEEGHNIPRLDTFAMIAGGLGVKPSVLLTLVEEEQEAER